MGTQKTASRRFNSVLATSICVALGGLMSVEQVLAAPPAWREGKILVQPRPGLSDGELDKVLNKHGGKAVGRLRNLNVHMVSVPAQAEEAVAKALARNPHIQFAEVDALLPPDAVPNDPQYGSAWHLSAVQASWAWDTSKGDGVTIAILDTGVDAAHSDLSAKLLTGWNSISKNTETADINGHGTAVAGTAAAATNNGLGVAGIAWNAKILPVRITNSNDGYAYFSDIANGLTWAADNGARVANISYDATSSSSIASAAAYMRQKGGVVAVAAGNSATNPGYSDSPYMISVAATTSTDTRASYSNYGNYIDVAAPGSSILTTSRGELYQYWSGTSFASPATAGVLALIMAANPSLTPDQVESVLEQSADNVGGNDWDVYYGHGRVNAFAAVQQAKQTVAVDSTPPTVSLTWPTSGAKVQGLVTVGVNATDNVGVSKVVLKVNGQSVATATTAPFQFSWDSTTLADGGATLTAEAYDAANNQATASVSVMVDNVPDPVDAEAPKVKFTNPASGATLKKTVSVKISATDNLGVTGLKFYIDGKLKGTTSASSLNYSWNTSKEPTGAHTLKAVGTDAAGNLGELAITVNVTR